MNYQTIIADLVKLGERQLRSADQAQEYIKSILKTNNVAFQYEQYETVIPHYERAELEIDGVPLETLGCGLVSGEITDADTVLSSLISSQKNLYDANINFNPRCLEISRSNHYQAPALAIKSSDVAQVLAAGTVRGIMEVKQQLHTAGFFLVGNSVAPEQIVVSHFDSIGPGAVDNASGVALSLQLILEQPELLTRILFIIDGNEEVSFDEGIYWGHGYRVFEDRYGSLLELAKKILVLDSFGYSAPELIKDLPTLTLAFPVANIQNLAVKSVLLSGSYQGLMEFYHAANDLPDRINDRHWEQSKQIILSEIENT